MVQSGECTGSILLIFRECIHLLHLPILFALAFFVRLRVQETMLEAWGLLAAQWLCVITVGVCTSLLPCAWTRRKGRHVCGVRFNKWNASLAVVCATWSLPVVLWFGFSPLNVCTRRIVYSYPHEERAHDGMVWTPFWCARRCDESEVVRGANVSHLQNLVLTRHVRALGGGHSSTDLQCFDAHEGSERPLLVPIHDSFCSFGGVDDESVATFGAGCTVDYALRTLFDVGYQLIGFGGITQQRLGGAISTSLHGQHTTSFSSHVRGVTAVVANGSLIYVGQSDPALKAWKGSMGRLGIVISVRIRVYPLQTVECVSDDAASESELLTSLSDPSLAGFEAKRILIGSEQNAAEHAYTVRTCTASYAPRHGPSDVYEDKDSPALAYAVDNVALPFVFLLGASLTRWGTFSSLLFRSSGVGTSRNEPTLSVNDYRVAVSFNPHFDEEYAVPITQCHALLEDVRGLISSRTSTLPPYVHAFIRRVDADDAWLSWAPVASCAVRFEYYDYNRVDLVEQERQFRGQVERLVVRRGGGGHRGKPWYGRADDLVRNAPHKEQFEAYRSRVDPDGKFENAFTFEMRGRGPSRIRNGLPADLQVRAFAWRVSVWLAVGASAFVAIAMCLLWGTRVEVVDARSTPHTAVHVSIPSPPLAATLPIRIREMELQHRMR